MIHGWMPEEEAKKEHPGWYEDIVSEEQKAK
jgi:cytochrome b subunit of formate dehydrogenase